MARWQQAVIFFDPARASDFAMRRKRGGHLVAKGRLLGAQFSAWLRNGHWQELARVANLCAAQLAEGLAGTSNLRLVWPTDANEVFAILPKSVDARLRAAGVYYYEWNPESLPQGESVAPEEVLVRLVTSFETTAEDILEFLDLAGGEAMAAQSD